MWRRSAAQPAQHGPRLFHQFRRSAEDKRRSCALLGRRFAAGEGRFEKKRAGCFHRAGEELRVQSAEIVLDCATIWPGFSCGTITFQHAFHRGRIGHDDDDHFGVRDRPPQVGLVKREVLGRPVPGRGPSGRRHEDFCAQALPMIPRPDHSDALHGSQFAVAPRVCQSLLRRKGSAFVAGQEQQITLRHQQRGEKKERDLLPRQNVRRASRR